MKRLLFISLTLLCISSSAQNVYTDISYSTTNHLGLNIYKTFNSGLIVGLGGSININSYNGETGRRYQELANPLIGSGDTWSNAFRVNYQTGNFTESTSSIKLLLGKEIWNTRIITTLGVGTFKEYWTGKDYDIMPGFTSPEKNFYSYKKAPIQFLYGAVLSHTISGRLGVVLGYNNVEKLTYGITYKFTPTEFFRD